MTHTKYLKSFAPQTFKLCPSCDELSLTDGVCFKCGYKDCQDSYGEYINGEVGEMREEI